MIDPRGMTLREWADSVILETSDAWLVGSLTDEAGWKDWAIQLLRANATQNLPDPYQFDDWRDWAERACPMIEVG